MSMTREELREWFADWLDDYYDFLEDDLTPEVAESALVALRAPAITPQNEWVSVEERLPPPNVRVLAYRPDEDDNSPYKYTNMWGWAVKESIRHKGITHWMYYPAPPGKEELENA